MKRIERLRKEALESCGARGHVMRRFESWGDGSIVATCKFCGRNVWIEPEPLANGIYIHGEAVALDCELKC